MLKQLTILIFVLFVAHNSAKAQNPCEPKPPVAICHETVVVQIPEEGIAKIFADAIDYGSIAFTCGNDAVDLTVARLDRCGQNCEDSDFSGSVEFNTDDLFTAVNVVLKVTDELGEVNSCMTSVKVLDSGDSGDDGNSNNGCTLACLDNLTISLSSEGTAQIWPMDFLESVCSGAIRLDIYDQDNNQIFAQTTEDYWTADADDVDQTYVYTITHDATQNSCWGNLLVVDKIGDNGTGGTSEGGNDDPHAEDVECHETTVDFSTFDIETEVSFSGLTLGAANKQLYNSYSVAFDEMLTSNGIDPKSQHFIIGYAVEDQIFEADNGDLKVIRTLTILDWCTGSVSTIVQTIFLTDISSMLVADIVFAEGSSNIKVNKLYLENENGQKLIPDVSADESLTESINAALTDAEWENGSYEIDVEKYESCQKEVTSIDMVHSMRHILGIQTFESNAQLVAADFNEDSKVSAADLVKMRKSILGIETCDNDSHWRFYKNDLKAKENFELGNLQNYKLTYDIDTNNPENVEIIALKKGDVNFSATTQASARSNTSIFELEDIDINSGEIYEIDFYTKEDLEFISADFEFATDERFEILEINSTQLPLETDHYHIANHSTKLVWYSEENTSIDADKPLFTLQIKSSVSSQLSNLFDLNSTRAEIYPDLNAKTAIISQIDFVRPATTDLVTDDLYKVNMIQGTLQVYPKVNTDINIQTLEIFNMAGQRLFQSKNIDQSSFDSQVTQSNVQILNYRITTDAGNVQVGKVLAH